MNKQITSTQLSVPIAQTDTASKSPELLQWKERAKKKMGDAIEKIQTLGKAVDAVSLFTSVIANLFVVPADQAGTDDPSLKLEILAYHLFPLFGYSTSTATPSHTNECIEALSQISISKLQSSFGTEGDIFYKIAAKVRMSTEQIRGMAYPGQTKAKIAEIQGVYESWFAERAGIGPVRAIKILENLHDNEHAALNAMIAASVESAKAFVSEWEIANAKNPMLKSDDEKKTIRFINDRDAAYSFGFAQKINEVSVSLLLDPKTLSSRPTDREVDALINLLGITKENRKTMTHSLEIRQKPLFVVGKDRVFIGNPFHVLDVLWKIFDEIAKTDGTFFQKRYQKKKEEWFDLKIAEYLSRIFPVNAIFKNLSYPDPDSKPGKTTELDFAVQWGPFVVFIEAKAKQFRMEGQLGDVGRLRSDVKANLEDAFYQAKRAARYVESCPEPQFTEIGTSRVLKIRKHTSRIYLLTLSFNDLAGLATSVMTLADLRLFTDKEYPVSMSIFDLDVISQFCDGADVFLHYIAQRRSFLKEFREVIADELDLYATYLETRLKPNRFAPKGKKADWLGLAGWSEVFDKWDHFNRGLIEKAPVIRLNVPPEIHLILKELRRHSDSEARLIAFLLLDLSAEELDILANGFRKIRLQSLKPGQSKCLVYEYKGTAISIVASLTSSSEVLHIGTMKRVILEKYKRRTSRSVGFGIMVGHLSRPFCTACWLEGEWNYDERIEKALKTDSPGKLTTGKVPSRNKPCSCGSKKKFKKCCLVKTQRN